MKAKGYYKKYGKKFKACIPEEDWRQFKGSAYTYAGMYPQFVTLLRNLQEDFSKDQQQLLHARRPETPEGLLNIIRDINQKWNALVRIFEKEQGGSPINPDGWGRLMNIRISMNAPIKTKIDQKKRRSDV